MQALLVSPSNDTLPNGTPDLLREIGWRIKTAPDYAAAMEEARNGAVDVVIAPAPTATPDRKHADVSFQAFLRLIEAKRMAALLISDGTAPFRPDAQSLVDVIDRSVTAVELRGRLSVIEKYHGLFRQMEQEIRTMERLTKRLHQHFHEVEQEMRLAGRLQKDFLPDLRQPIANLRFAEVYRPVTWVSGDIFDVFRIDEDHVGLYVADAVGHGMAASLLTMFIRRAVVPKKVEAHGYRIVSPSEVMVGLNDALAEEALPNCQFVTACYALLNQRTLTLQYARGGHPYPLLITSAGASTELKSSGGLLGISKGEEFPTFECRLDPGDKVLFYTDGVELVFQGDKQGALDTASYRGVFERHARLPIVPMLRQIESELDAESGSLNARDDITIVGMEVLPEMQ